MKPKGEPLLEIDDLYVSYDSQPYLQGVSLEVWPEQVVALVGPNGAGKTTILKAVGGLLPRSRLGLGYEVSKRKWFSPTAKP